MATITTGLANEAKIAAGVERAKAILGPDVVRILFSFEDDWTGDPSIFFRVVLSDEVSRSKGLGEFARQVASTIEWEVNSVGMGLNPYFNYRSVSEQAAMKEPAWA